MRESGYTQYNKTVEYAAEVLVKTFHEVSRKTHKKLNFEITHEKYVILEIIYLNPGILQFEIAQQISMHRSYVCKFLSQLQKEGYIRREEHIKGKRKIILKNFLTPKGEELYHKIKNYIINEILLSSTDDEIEEFNLITQKLLNRANKMKERYSIQF